MAYDVWSTAFDVLFKAREGEKRATRRDLTAVSRRGSKRYIFGWSLIPSLRFRPASPGFFPGPPERERPRRKAGECSADRTIHGNGSARHGRLQRRQSTRLGEHGEYDQHKQRGSEQRSRRTVDRFRRLHRFPQVPRDSRRHCSDGPGTE